MWEANRVPWPVSDPATMLAPVPGTVRSACAGGLHDDLPACAGGQHSDGQDLGLAGPGGYAAALRDTGLVGVWGVDGGRRSRVMGALVGIVDVLRRNNASDAVGYCRNDVCTAVGSRQDHVFDADGHCQVIVSDAAGLDEKLDDLQGP